MTELISRVWGLPFTGVNEGTVQSVVDKNAKAIELASIMASLLGDADPSIIQNLKLTETNWMNEAIAFARAANGEPVMSDLLSIPGSAVKRDSKLVGILGFDRVLNHKADALRFLGASKEQIAEL